MVVFCHSSQAADTNQGMPGSNPTMQAPPPHLTSRPDDRVRHRRVARSTLSSSQLYPESHHPSPVKKRAHRSVDKLVKMEQDGDPYADIEIPIRVGGCEKWLNSLTRRTTCDDVIYALLFHDRNPNLADAESDVDLQGYAIFERWRGVERALSGRTKILKVWRTWGAEVHNVRLTLRKVDNICDTSSEVSHCHKSTSRRKHRSRHKDSDRHADKKSSRCPSCSHKSCNCPPRKDKSGSGGSRERADDDDPSSTTWSVEKHNMLYHLVQMVLNQEKMIRDQLKRISHLDYKVHQKEKLVEDKDNVLVQVDSSDVDQVVHTEESVKTMDQYIGMCEQIADMDCRITEEQGRIDDLSVLIHNESISGGEAELQHGGNPGQGGTEDHSKQQLHIDELKHELQRSVSLSTAQQKQMTLVNQTISQCEHELHRKSRHIKKLLARIDEEEEVDRLVEEVERVDEMERAEEKLDEIDIQKQTLLIRDIPHSEDDLDVSDDLGVVVDSPSLFKETSDPQTDKPSHHQHNLPLATSYGDIPSHTVTSHVGDSSDRPELRENCRAKIARIKKHMVPYRTYTTFSSSNTEDLSSQKSAVHSDDSDTGLSSLHSDEPLPIFETLV